MKYVQINAYCGGWADSIIFSKHRKLQAQGVESYVFWARGAHEEDKYMQKIAHYPEVCLDVVQTRLDGKAGFHSKGITKRLLKKLDEINPDVVHLHILLGYYINIEMLFNWLAEHSCQVKWTLHDCWAFTGHCIYFTYVKCIQWKRHCIYDYPCPQISTYPKTYCKKNVGWNFEQKKRLFTMLPENRLHLITPSYWLANLVKQSFLAKYNVEVVHNTVNTDIFKPTPSDFRRRYGLEDKFIVLGVASVWSERKGLDDFIQLANELDDSFAIVLVGLNKKQMKHLPKQIIALPRTDTPQELAEIYSAANVLFNPTKEDNYPTVNLEAEACGTPVVTYDVGGCRETIHLIQSRIVNDVDGLLDFLREAELHV